MRCSPAALKALMAYPWPGNVRELENCIQRGMLLCDGETVDIASLPDRIG